MVFITPSKQILRYPDQTTTTSIQFQVLSISSFVSHVIIDAIGSIF
jgi:hypothetical protein